MPPLSWPSFITLGDDQYAQLYAFQKHLLQFNRHINLISRDGTEFFEERHLLHTLALVYKAFPAGSTVVDWGTGGGLPAIPLAIAFPEVTFHAVDTVGKKVQAVEVMARRLGLENLQPWHGRAEAWPGRTSYSVSRATAPLLELWQWHLNARTANSPAIQDDTWRPGLICLKGGDLHAEIEMLQTTYPRLQIETTPLRPLVGLAYYIDKVIVEVFEV